MSRLDPQDTPLGASSAGAGDWCFLVWAPDRERVAVALLDDDGRDLHPMQPAGDGYFVARIDGLSSEPAYRYVLDDEVELADPSSRQQPDGVFGPSHGFDPAEFAWTDAGFVAVALAESVIYEVHVGTFTAEGTFDAAARRLDELVELGVTAVEIMPVSAFPGHRNWGYDGAFPFAVQASYGGPAGLQRFVDVCHARGLAMYLDVVYNHLGPEGVVHREFGPYFTDTYTTPWGAAMNFSESGSDQVRRYFLDNAVMWCRDFHVDGLRVDAVHGIVDATASPFLRELTDAIHEVGVQTGRDLVLIAESADNDPFVVAPAGEGGLGFDAQWNDDFHHAVHARLTGERDGYYADYGGVDKIVRSLSDGFVFRGEFSAFRGRRHGTALRDVDPRQLVCFIQNHDQVGNRAGAERLATLIGHERASLAAAMLLLAPVIPMLFMGEEYAETAPFPYFVDHGDQHLLDAIRGGRAAEFGRDADRFDPAAESTFVAAQLDRSGRESAQGRAMLAVYRALIDARRRNPALRSVARRRVNLDGDVVAASSQCPGNRVHAMFNCGPHRAVITMPTDGLDLVLSSDGGDARPGGPDAAGLVALEGWGFALFANERDDR